MLDRPDQPTQRPVGLPQPAGSLGFPEQARAAAQEVDPVARPGGPADGWHASSAIELVKQNVVFAPPPGLPAHCLDIRPQPNMEDLLGDEMDCCPGQLDAPAEVTTEENPSELQPLLR